MTAHKAFQIDFDAWSGYDQTPDALRLLSDADIAALVSLTEYLRWRTRWKNAPAREYLTDYVDGLIDRLLRPVTGGDMAFELRQNPENPCLLEQSLDGGETWLPAFDYELCADRPGEIEFINWQQELSNNAARNNAWQSDWDGTPQSIHPGAPTSVDEDAATCAAVLAYVERVLWYALNTRRTALGLAALAAGGLGWLGGIFGAVFGGLVVAALAIDLAALEAAAADRSAIEQIACKLFNNIKSRAFSWVNLQNAANAIVASSDNETTIKNVVVAYSTNFIENYWLLVEFVGTAADAAGGGMVFNCVCDGWCYEWDLTLSNGGWAAARFTSPADGAAVYYAGEGFAPNFAAGSVFNEVMMIKRNFAPAAINKVRVRLNTGMRGAGGYPALLVWENNTSTPKPGVFQWQRYVTGGSNATQWTYQSAEAIWCNGLTLALTTDRIGSSGYYPIQSSCRMISIQFAGYGENPFGENNCTW